MEEVLSMSELLLLCWEFFKTGLFAVGGGLATIPFLTEMGSKYGWFTTEELMMMLAVSESTPGPIGINMSTYVGYHLFGFLGGVLTTLSLVAPSLIVILIIARVYLKFKESKVVEGIFVGLRAAVVGLILSATVGIYQSAFWQSEGYEFWQHISLPCVLLFIALLAFYKWKDKLHPIVIILLAGIVGVVFSF